MSLTSVIDPTQHDELTGDEQIVEEARSRYKLCTQYESLIREDANKDLKFLSGEMWDQTIRDRRERDSRPTLTINRLNPFVNKVKNDMIENLPDIKVRPVDNSDSKTANVINGIIRHIVNNLDGKSAITWALTCAIRCGIGYYRIKSNFVTDGTDYSNEAFLQELSLERIEDPLLVHFPVPLCKMQDYSDAPYCVIRTLMSKRDFKELYPDKWDDFLTWESNHTEAVQQWVTEEGLWLAEYFRVEHDRKPIYLLSNGAVVDSKENLPEGITVKQEREIDKRRIMRYLLSGASILERSEILAKNIPIVPIFGDELIADGNKRYISLIRFAKDVQSMYNMWKSKETEQIALAPKAPFMAAMGQIDKYIDDWKAANTKNIAVLQYNPISYDDGSPVPPPSRLMPPSIDAATLTASNSCIEDIKAVTGIYDASLGNKGNETSGKGIIARQRQSDTANAHFYESLVRALRFTGKILIDMIPNYYDTPRILRIVGESMTDEVVKVNQQYYDEKDGNTKYYDVAKVANYAVVVQTGPSYETRRQETAQNIISLIQANPNLFNTLGDILVQNLDWEGSDRAARRIRAMIPPEVLAADDDESMDTNKVQAMVMQLRNLQQKTQMDGQQMQQMDQLIQEMQAQLKSKTEELMNKVHTTDIKAQAEVTKAQMGVQQAQINAQADMNKHAIDTAMKLNEFNGQQIGQPQIYGRPAGQPSAWKSLE